MIHYFGNITVLIWNIYLRLIGGFKKTLKKKFLMYHKKIYVTIYNLLTDFHLMTTQTTMKTTTQTKMKMKNRLPYNHMHSLEIITPTPLYKKILYVLSV